MVDLAGAITGDGGRFEGVVQATAGTCTTFDLRRS
jgi:hypothetical protein